MQKIWKWFQDAWNWLKDKTKPLITRGGMAMKEVMKKIGKWLWDRKGFTAIVGILYLAFAVVFFLLQDKGVTLGEAEGAREIYWRWMWLAAVIAYTVASITGTGLNERALRLFFGKLPIGGEIPPQSLTFVPLGLFELLLVPIDIQENELPGEPEQIWRFKDDKDQELPLGIGKDGKEIPEPHKIIKENGQGIVVNLPWVQPIRVLFSNQDLKDKDDPIYETSKFFGMPKIMASLGKGKGKRKRDDIGKDPALERVTAEVVSVVYWRVRGISDFFRSYGSFANAQKALADIVIAEQTAVLQVGTPARALANQELLGLHILRKVRETVDHEVGPAGQQRNEAGDLVFDQEGKPVMDTCPCHPKGKTGECRRGIEIVLFKLKPPNFSHDYNQSIQAVPEATAKAHADALKGGGEQRHIQALKEVAGTAGGELLLALERLKTVERTIGRNDKIVLIDSRNPVAALLGAVGVGKTLLEEKKTSSSPEKKKD